MTVSHKEFCGTAIQRLVALLQHTAAVGHILRHIHFHAAEQVHHFFHGGHVDGNIMVDGQLQRVADHIAKRCHAFFVRDHDRVDLAVARRVGSVRRCDRAAHKGVAGDLQKAGLFIFDIEVHIHDHIGHAVVGAIAVRAGLTIVAVDAAHQNVHHIARIFIGCANACDQILQRRGIAVRLDGVHNDLPCRQYDHKQHSQRYQQRHQTAVFLFSSAGFLFCAAAAGRL